MAGIPHSNQIAHNNRFQRTPLRVAAEPERYRKGIFKQVRAAIIGKFLSMLTHRFRTPTTASVAKLRAATSLPIVLCRQILECLEPDIHAKVLHAMESQIGSNLLHDPIEDDPNIQPLLTAADGAAERELAGIQRGMGFCHRFWAAKKRILRDQHGVFWLSPQDMNPWTRFD